MVLGAGITLADTGLAVARAEAGGIVLHAALAERAFATDGATSLAAIALALRPIVLRAAVKIINDSNGRAPMSP